MTRRQEALKAYCDIVYAKIEFRDKTKDKIITIEEFIRSKYKSGGGKYSGELDFCYLTDYFREKDIVVIKRKDAWLSFVDVDFAATKPYFKWFIYNNTWEFTKDAVKDIDWHVEKLLSSEE